MEEVAVRRAVGGPDSRAGELLHQVQEEPEVALADALKSTMAQVIADRLWPPAVTGSQLR